MKHDSESFQVLRIRKKRLLNLIVASWSIIICFLGLADIFLNHYEWVDSDAIQRLLNITRDDGLANWFSSVQLLAVGVILWLIFASLVYSKPNLIMKKSEKLGWGLSALFFTYLAVDDGSKLHERIGTAFSNSMEVTHQYNPGVISKLFDIFPSYGWQFVFVPVFGLIALFMLFFLIKNLKTKNQIIFMFIGFSCYGASVCFDFVEGMNETIYDSIVSFFNTDLHTVQHFSKLIEELIEMIGNTFFMLTFTQQLLSLSQGWKIELVNSFEKKADL